MTDTPGYPFSDLSRDQVERLIEVARVERSQAFRSFLAGLFRVRRQREAQVWTPAHAPALSLEPHC
jgi:hypothetical protein